MKVIKLREPRIRLKIQPTQEYSYKTSTRIFLPKVSRIPRVSFFATILKRKSRREFAELSVDDLSVVLWFTCKTLEKDHGFANAWQHRCTPSAGGIHPIDVLIFTPTKSTRRLFLYDAVSHSLGLLSEIRLASLQRLLTNMNKVIPVGRATLFLFVAQFQKTLSRYENCESLVWRDSGALLASICLVAQALSLNCCGIGATGNPYISDMFAETDKLAGVGGCLIGSRLKHS